MNSDFIIPTVFRTALKAGINVRAAQTYHNGIRHLMAEVKSFKGKQVTDDNHFIFTNEELSATVNSKKVAEYYAHLLNCHMATQINLDPEIKEWLMRNH